MTELSFTGNDKHMKNFVTPGESRNRMEIELEIEINQIDLN